MTGDRGLRIIGDGHEITPVKDSARRTKPGFGTAPADIMRPDHYPMEAICVECRTVVRIDYFAGDWYHTGRQPGETATR